MDEKHIILIVDDTPENLRLLGDMLEHEGYEVMVATNGPDALENARAVPRPDLILLDIMMPVMDGYEVCRRLKSDPDLKGIPVIFISAIMAEFRDPETGEHIQRTKHYVRLLAQELNKSSATHFSSENIELLLQCVPLHDIGKVAVPDAILNKHATLTVTEFDEIKKHTQYGTEVIKRTEAILGSSSFLQYARELAEYHHERWDGSGYPNGLKGTDIPVCARLMMLADIYDALIAKRPYKESLPHEVAFRIITDGDGRTMPEHFDPDVLKAFCKLHQEFDRIARELSALKTDRVEESG